MLFSFHNGYTIHSVSTLAPFIRNYDTKFLTKLFGMCFSQSNIVVYNLQ